MTTDYDTRTYIDKAGVERWNDDDTVIDQTNVFRTAYNGVRIDTAKMAQSARNSAGSSRAVSRDAAAGKPRGTLRGISRKSESGLKVGIPDVYAPAPKLESIKEHQHNTQMRAVGSNVPNWATVKRNQA